MEQQWQLGANCLSGSNNQGSTFLHYMLTELLKYLLPLLCWYFCGWVWCYGADWQLYDVRTFKELETYRGHRKEVTGLLCFLWHILLLPLLLLRFWICITVLQERDEHLQWKRNQSGNMSAQLEQSCTKLCSFFPAHSTDLASISWGAVCEWKLWWQHNSLASWVSSLVSFVS